MVSANQAYKSSKSELPFKEWLKREQLKGKLEVHDNEFLNADGEETYTGEVTDTISCNCRPYAKLLFGFALGYLVCKVITKK